MSKITEMISKVSGKKVIQISDELEDRLQRFINNNEKWLTGRSKETRLMFLPIALRVYQELTRNFTVPIEVLEDTTNTKEVSLKASWNYKAEETLKEIHNIDLGEEMMDLLAYEIISELKGCKSLHSFKFEEDGKVTAFVGKE